MYLPLLEMEIIQSNHSITVISVSIATIIFRTLAGRTFQADPHLPPPDSALDWGDFFFNLVSMCIMYAHFSEAIVASEGSAAVIFSMSIAAVDVILLAARWLWYEHFFTHR